MLYILPMCTFLISFGGLSIMVQAMAFVEFKKPSRYIGVKLLHGIISAAIAYVMMVLFPNSMETFSGTASMYVVNAISGLSVLFACALGTAAATLFALIFGSTHRSS